MADLITKQKLTPTGKGSAGAWGYADIEGARKRETDQMNQCQAKGGRWDSATKKCVMPTKSSLPGSVVNDAETGKVSGFINKSGDFVKAGVKDTQNIVNKQNAQQIQGNFVTTEQIAQVQNQAQQEAMMMAGGVQMTPDGRQIIQDGGVVENIATGGAALAGGIGGAKVGAALGTLVAPGLGTVIGGVVGGIGGAIGGAYVKLRIQKGQDIKQANKVFTQAKTNRNEILNMVNAGIVTEGQARELWAEEKQNINAVHRYLKQQTTNDLDAFLGQPGDEYIAVNSYLRLENLYDIEFEKALMQPNPNKILSQEMIDNE